MPSHAHAGRKSVQLSMYRNSGRFTKQAPRPRIHESALT